MQRTRWHSLKSDASVADLKQSQLVLDPSSDINQLFDCYNDTPWRCWINMHRCAQSRLNVVNHNRGSTLTRRLEEASSPNITRDRVFLRRPVSCWTPALLAHVQKSSLSATINVCHGDCRSLWSKLQPLLKPASVSTSSLTAYEFAICS